MDFGRVCPSWHGRDPYVGTQCLVIFSHSFIPVIKARLVSCYKAPQTSAAIATRRWGPSPGLTKLFCCGQPFHFVGASSGRDWGSERPSATRSWVFFFLSTSVDEHAGRVDSWLSFEGFCQQVEAENTSTSQGYGDRVCRYFPILILLAFNLMLASSLDDYAKCIWKCENAHQ